MTRAAYWSGGIDATSPKKISEGFTGINWGEVAKATISKLAKSNPDPRMIQTPDH